MKHFIFITFFLSLFLVKEVMATSQSQLNAVNTKIVTLKKNLTLKKNQRVQLEKELNTIDKNIANMTHQMEVLSQQMDAKQSALLASRDKLTDLEKESAAQKIVLGKQLRASYQLGQYEYIHLLLNQQDPSTVLRLMAYYNYLNKARIETLAKIQETEEKIDQEQKIIATQLDQLSHLSTEKQAKKILLEKEREKQQKIMAQLNQDIQTKSSQLKAYEADKKFLEALIQRLDRHSHATTSKTAPVGVQSKTVGANNIRPKANEPIESAAPMIYKIKTGSFSQEMHHLIWPTRGKLLNRANVPAMRHQSGIVILAPEGQPVVAVFPGKVVFSGALKGFGLLMIIDHGQGFMTLYAHNQALYRKRGEQVNAGDLIAYVGHTGILPQSGLYFEIRHFGRPLNPLQWLAKGS